LDVQQQPPVWEESLRHLLAPRGFNTDDLQVVLAHLGSLGPADVFPTERRISSFFGYQEGLSNFVERARMWRYRGLARIYLFHWNGYFREAALKLIGGDLGSAFAFTVIAYRLNDWVAEVRAAAEECARRSFPATNPAAIAEGALFLLRRIDSWGRWTTSPGILQETLQRQDVLDQLADRFMTLQAGRASFQFRMAIAFTGMDRHLARLAANAASPVVRAIALRTLVEERARWPNGFERKWIDKSLGKARTVVRYAERPVVRPPALESLLGKAALDRAVFVRLVVADWVVKHRATLENVDELLAAFRRDKSPAVRLRAEFIDRERAARSLVG
jgi:hypothetical protein